MPRLCCVLWVVDVDDGRIRGSTKCAVLWVVHVDGLCGELRVCAVVRACPLRVGRSLGVPVFIRCARLLNYRRVHVRPPVDVEISPRTYVVLCVSRVPA